MLSANENKLETCLATISLLEKENQELRHEVARLKTLLSSIKAQDNDLSKSMLLKKLQPVSISATAAKVPFQKQEAVKERVMRVPRPPPMPITNSTPPLFKEVDGTNITTAPAPPPPPLPKKSLAGSSAVRRVPQVLEFYRLLTRKDTFLENKMNSSGIQAAKFSKNMIGEIENRSVYLTAIKSDVETQGEFINFIAREVTNAAHTEISEVEAFVKWLDEEMSYLVDERAVLKHFKQWPERKSDALREAAFSYRDLKNLESEASSFKDNPNEQVNLALKRMQALQDRLEQSVNNIERVRESASKRYRDFRIPWEWMLDTGMIGQLKLSSIRLARQHMKRIVEELKSNQYSHESELLLQGVRFAYRVHQFAGGFDAYTTQAFEELKNFVTCNQNDTFSTHQQAARV